MNYHLNNNPKALMFYTMFLSIETIFIRNFYPN
jgi:hypothetical protein